MYNDFIHRKYMKIIIIGNGFDLSLGFKTSYTDFISSDFFESLITEKNSLALYLTKKNELNNWVDIEQELTNYSIYTKDQLNVKDDFKALKIALMNYLKEAQEAKINQKSKAFQMIQDEITTTDKIYNFNYTNTVFKVAEALKIENITNKHEYVHGSIENSDIIFGVEDDAIIHQNHIFLKKSYNRNFGKSTINKALNRNINHNLIVFGHSLGTTDSSYFEKYIFSLTYENENSELKFYHYGDTGYDDMMKIFDKYTQQNLSDFIHKNNFLPIDSSEK